MAGLVPVHGGLDEPIDRTVSGDRLETLERETTDSPTLELSEADVSSLYRIGDGALSPLTGPMTGEQWHRCLDDGVLENEGVAYAWTIPISFPVSTAEAGSLAAGGRARLVDSAGQFLGAIQITDVFDYDKAKYLRSVYQTERTDHPGGRMVMDESRDRLVGGVVEVRPPAVHADYGRFVLKPTETRALFQSKGWTRVVAFQTRNPLHRAHEYALVYGLETLVRECDTAGAVLNPLIGETKSDDVDAATRMRTYQTLMDARRLGEGDADAELWASKPYDLADRVILLGLDIKMFYGGPKEAVMHAIYRQNYGFTDIIIGRKHADAPFDDGSDIWDGLAAQHIFDDLPGKLEIRPLKVGFAAYYESMGRVDLMDKHPDEKPVFISGRQVREELQSGKMPDPRIMRPETAEILIERMRQP